MCKEEGENPLHALPEFVQRFPRDRSKTTQYHPVLVKKNPQNPNGLQFLGLPRSATVTDRLLLIKLLMSPSLPAKLVWSFPQEDASSSFWFLSSF